MVRGHYFDTRPGGEHPSYMPTLILYLPTPCRKPEHASSSRPSTSLGWVVIPMGGPDLRRY